MYIELTAGISGTRASGDRYPPPWTAFEVADWEGEHLVRAGIAREVSAPAPAPAMPEKPAAVEARPVAAADRGNSPVAAPAEAPAPSPSDPKAAWVDFAVAQGANRSEAEVLTKPQLQQAYGGRL